MPTICSLTPKMSITEIAYTIGLYSDNFALPRGTVWGVACGAAFRGVQT